MKATFSETSDSILPLKSGSLLQKRRLIKPKEAEAKIKIPCRFRIAECAMNTPS